MLVRFVMRWNGMVMKIGKFGLYVLNWGGLDLLDLKLGKIVCMLILCVVEGVFSIDVMFIENDKYVVYYYFGYCILWVFWILDGIRIVNFKVYVEVMYMVGMMNGEILVVGVVDGSLIIFIIVDLEYDENVEFL